MKKRSGKIDLLKFLFAIIVVIHHGANVVGEDNAIFLGGAFAVEFFFIVSGYLMMASIQRLPQSGQSLGIETRDFILKKFKGLYPEVLIAFVMATVVVFLVGKHTLKDQLILSFHQLTLLNMSGMGVVSVNSATWYLSSMLLGMLILFPLIRKKPKFMVNVGLPLLILLILGAFSGNKMSPRNPMEWMEITYKGNLRALAELSIGVCAYPLVEKLKSVNFTVFGRILLTVVEYACYISLIEYMRSYGASRRDYFYLAVYLVAIIISFSQQGIDVRLFSGRFFSWLGKFSFDLYLAHHFWASNINAYLPEDFSLKQRMIAYFICAGVSALAVMLLAALMRKLGKVLKKPIRKLIIAESEEEKMERTA